MLTAVRTSDQSRAAAKTANVTAARFNHATATALNRVARALRRGSGTLFRSAATAIAATPRLGIRRGDYRLPVDQRPRFRIYVTRRPDVRVGCSPDPDSHAGAVRGGRAAAHRQSAHRVPKRSAV